MNYFKILSLLYLIISNASFAQNEKSIFNEMIKTIKQQYAIELTEDQIYQKSYQGLLSSLDPHSEYYDEKEFKELQSFSSGEFNGIGVELTQDDGLIKITSTYEEGAAYKAGLRSGDIIIAINSNPIKGLKLKEVVDKIKSKDSSKIKLTIFRELSNQSFDVEINREKLSIPTIKSKLLFNDIAYIKISAFNSKTSIQTQEALKNLFTQNKKISGLILDLRNNPGGLLDQAIEVADLFLDKGTIVSVHSRIETKVFNAKPGDLLNSLPIVVIINSGTASAPEIVAASLQENKRAIIVGEKSFGKGSVQTIIPIKNGGAIKLTTAMYHTPLNNSIQAVGIVPNIIVKPAIIKEISNSKISESSFSNHIKSTATKNNKLHEKITQPEITDDFQVARAIDTLRSIQFLK